jgi:hypothetical protein
METAVPRQSRISTDPGASSVPVGSQANERERGTPE